jgi:polyhydroxybutyrate depolymerase
MKSTRLACVLAALFLTAGASTAQAQAPAGGCATRGGAGVAYDAGVNCRVVEVDGHPRRFIAYVPSRRPSAGRAPVVFMFHGSSGSGEQFLRISGWREVADRRGLVAVFPTALRYRVLESGRRITKWNAFGLENAVDLSERPPGYPAQAPMPADDVAFVDSILGDLDAQLPVDRHRIYASGFSNGGDFAARLGVDRSTRFAAVAHSAGGLSDAHAPARPVPTYLSAGTLDDRLLARTGEPPLDELPLDAAEILAAPVFAPVLDAHLATLGLDESDLGVITRPRSTSLRWPASGLGRGGAVFRFSLLAGVRHQYPNGRNNPAGFAAAPEFWSFFRRHRLP